MSELGEDAVGELGPYAGARGGAVLADVTGDGLLQISNGLEGASPQTPSGERGEEALDGVDPGRRSRGEMEHVAGMPLQPGAGFEMFVGGVVVGDGVDQPARRNGTLDVGEGANELLMTMLAHAAAQGSAVPDIERGKQGIDAVAHVTLRHGAAFAWFDRQPGLCTGERLILRLFVDEQHRGVHRRIHVQAGDVLEFLRESRVVGALEGAQPVRSAPALYRVGGSYRAAEHPPPPARSGLASATPLVGSPRPSGSFRQRAAGWRTAGRSGHAGRASWQQFLPAAIAASHARTPEPTTPTSLTIRPTWHVSTGA